MEKPSRPTMQSPVGRAESIKASQVVGIKREYVLSGELAKVKLLLERFPLFSLAETETLPTRERRVLQTLLDDLLWTIFVAKRNSNEVIGEMVREYTNAAEFSRATKCKLSLAMACDCLQRLARESPVLQALCSIVFPILFQDYENGKSFYQCKTRIEPVAQHDGYITDESSSSSENIDSAKSLRMEENRENPMFDRFGIALSRRDHTTDPTEGRFDRRWHELNNAFEQASMGMRAKFLAKIALDPKQTKLWERACRRMRKPPSVVVDVLIELAGTDRLNRESKQFVILDRVMMDKTRIADLRKQREDMVLPRERGTGKDAQRRPRSKSRVQDSQPLYSCEALETILQSDGNRLTLLRQLLKNNSDLRKNVFRAAIEAENNEQALSKNLILTLQHVESLEPSDEFFDRVLQTESMAVRGFLRRLHSMAPSKCETCGHPTPEDQDYNPESTQMIQPDEEEKVDHPTEIDVDLQSSATEGVPDMPTVQASEEISAIDDDKNEPDSKSEADNSDGDSTNGELKVSPRRKTEKQTQNQRKSRYRNGRDKWRKHLNQLGNSPMQWRKFLRSCRSDKADQNDGAAKRSKITRRQLRAQILQFYLAKVKADAVLDSRGNNKTSIAAFVVQHMLFHLGAKQLLQQKLLAIINRLESNKNDPWLSTFAEFCGMTQDEPILQEDENVLNCFLTAIAFLEDDLIFVPKRKRPSKEALIKNDRAVQDERRKNELPRVQLGKAQEMVKYLHFLYPHLDVESISDEIASEQAEEKNNVGAKLMLVPIDVLMNVILRSALNNAKAKRARLLQIFNKFDMNKNHDLDLSEFGQLMRASAKAMGDPIPNDVEIQMLYIRAIGESESGGISETMFLKYFHDLASSLGHKSHLRQLVAGESRLNDDDNQAEAQLLQAMELLMGSSDVRRAAKNVMNMLIASKRASGEARPSNQDNSSQSNHHENLLRASIQLHHDLSPNAEIVSDDSSSTDTDSQSSSNSDDE